MTQALNLANFANNLNTSGATSNAGLQNSTISGVALGSNLIALTIGTGLSGSSYNGSSAVTIANTGVTSVTAGTGISVSASTGGVTITNTSSSTYIGQKAQLFTSNGTFTVPSGITAFKVTLCGGGGGGNQGYSGAPSGGSGGSSTFSTATSTGGGGAINTSNGSNGSASGATFSYYPSNNNFYSNLSSGNVYGTGGGGGATGGDSPVGTWWLTGLSGSITVTVGAGGSADRAGPGTQGFVLIEW